MSDTPQGPGWWLASDGKYYPPQPPAAPPGQWTQPGPVVQPGPAAPPGQWSQPGPVVQPGPAPSTGSSGCLKVGLIVLAVLAVMGLGVVGCLAVVGGGVVSELEREVERAFGEADPSDYSITGPECSVDSFDDVRASGRITNDSTERQAFQIQVRFVEPDGSLITSDSTFTNGLDPGQSTEWEVITFSDAPPEFDCVIDLVSYSIFD